MSPRFVLACALVLSCGGGGNPPNPPSGNGTLQVTVSGLPSGTNASVSIAGPGGFSQSITATQSLTVAAGAYTITASNVTSGSDSYSAAVTGSPATVVSAQTANVSVAYSLLQAGTGSLQVNISGVGTADVTISGPAGYSHHLTATATLTSLTPGSYSVTGATVGNATAQVTGSPATVTAGQTATVSVAYSSVVQSTGSLHVEIAGVPTADVDVAGPGGYSQHLTATATLTSLTPGSYTVTANDVGNYTAQVIGAPATVTAGNTANVEVGYSPPLPGKLQVNVNGNPGGEIDVSGPGGYANSTVFSDLFTGLQAGSYTVTANDFSGYTHSVTGSPAAVTAGNTTTVTVTYTPLPTGTLLVKTTAGNPPFGDLFVSGPDDYFQEITASPTSLTVPIGSYTVTATAYTSSGITYSPTPASSTVDVTAAATTEVDVAYLPPAPTATSISPSYGIPGSKVAVVGTNFVNAGTIANFGAAQLTPDLVSGTTVLEFTIPGNTAPGNYPISVTTAGGTTTSFTFNVYVVDVFPLPDSMKSASGAGFLVGPDGNFWFVDESDGMIGTMTPTGTATGYAPSAESCFEPMGLTIGSDGNLWFGSACKPRLGRITTAGVFTFFDMPNGCIPYSLTSGPGGLLWIGTGNCTSSGHAGVDTFDPAVGQGSFVEYPYASAVIASTQSLALGYDGDLWVTKSFNVGHVSTGGSWATDVQQLGIQIPILEGPNDHMWFGNNDFISEIDETGTVTNHPACANGGFTLPSVIYDSVSSLIWCWSINGGGGITSYDAAANKNTNYSWGPLNGSVTWGVTQDANGDVWMYTNGQGLKASSISHLRK